MCQTIGEDLLWVRLMTTWMNMGHALAGCAPRGVDPGEQPLGRKSGPRSAPNQLRLW